MSEPTKKMTIWKHPIESVNEPADIMMPKGSKILSTAFDPKTTRICVCALVDPEEKVMDRKRVILYSTGNISNVIPDSHEERFIGLAIINAQVKKSNLALPGGNEIQVIHEFYHVFEIIEKN